MSTYERKRDDGFESSRHDCGVAEAAGQKGGVKGATQYSDERMICSAGMVVPEGSRGGSSEVLRGMSDVGA